MGLVKPAGVPIPLVLNVPSGATSDVVLSAPSPAQINVGSGTFDSLLCNNGHIIVDGISKTDPYDVFVMDQQGFFSANALLGAPITPVSGTVYQNTNTSPDPGYDVTLYLPATYYLAFENTGTLTGTIQLALGSTTPPGDFGPAFTVGADQTIVVPLRVPPQWYWSVTQSGSLAPEILEASVVLGA